MGKFEDVLHEHRAPSSWFSACAFSQLQCMAACLPQEHLASLAQMQPPVFKRFVSNVWS